MSIDGGMENGNIGPQNLNEESYLKSDFILEYEHAQISLEEMYCMMEKDRT